MCLDSQRLLYCLWTNERAPRFRKENLAFRFIYAHQPHNRQNFNVLTRHTGKRSLSLCCPHLTRARSRHGYHNTENLQKQRKPNTVTVRLLNAPLHESLGDLQWTFTWSWYRMASTNLPMEHRQCNLTPHFSKHFTISIAHLCYLSCSCSLFLLTKIHCLRRLRSCTPPSQSRYLKKTRKILELHNICILVKTLCLDKLAHSVSLKRDDQKYDIL